MYKSKLQEYCQSKAWRLPEYATSADGPSHDRRFKAVVTLNDVSYAPSGPSKSSKLAQNEAARIAFEKLCGSSIPSDGSQVLNATSGMSHSTTQGKSDSACASETTDADDGEMLNELAYMCKNQLQIYAQKNSLTLPSYTTEPEGPPHASRFKSKVSINGRTYESTEFCKTVKQAENAAARVALMSMPSDVMKEVGPIFCKNLLQELVQKEYSCLPIYSTNQSGASHVPLFVSTVEINGEVFQGQEAKTKKQSETSAAMVAYAALKGRDNNSHNVLNEAIIESSEKEINSRTTNIPGGDRRSATPSSSIAEETPPSLASIQQSAPPIKRNSLQYQDLAMATSAQQSDNSNVGPAGALPSNIGRKIVVFPREANMVFPPGINTISLHNDDKWTAMTIGLYQVKR